MAVFYKDLSRIIRLDKNISKIPSPELILKTRDFRTLGNIPNYTNWKVSIQGNTIDEISFDVAKYTDCKLCPVWDDLVDLKVIELERYGCFEIEVTYTDNTKTVKSINGYSLERELGQLYLHDFHVNDDEAKTMVITEYNQKDFDKDGNYINTVFYNPEDEDHSLLHRILKEKAPHWSIGDVTKYIAPAEDKVIEDSKEYVRSFTADNTSVYDFLTQDIAQECNVVFLFDTLHRQINCYSVINGLNKDGSVAKISYGEDTNVYISKDNLATEITLTPNVDQIKNCFRIQGGDDTINANLRTVNVSGSNYIYNFDALQKNDMSPELIKKLNEYQNFLKDKSDIYQNLMLQLQDAYEKQSYLKSVMSPASNMKEDIETWTKKTAQEQFEDIRSKLISGKIGVENTDNATRNRVNNNIESMAQVYSDARFTVEVITDENITSYDKKTKTWTGTILVKRVTDNSVYPPSRDVYKDYTFSVQVVDDKYNLTYTQQKLQIRLTECDIFDVDTDISSMTDEEIKAYFLKYSLNRLYSFRDAYDTAISLLQESLVNPDNTKEITEKVQEFYNKYLKIKNIINECYQIRSEECKEQDSLVTILEGQCSTIQSGCDMKSFLGTELYTELYKYIREDTYENNNYISDNLTNAQAMDKAKDLLEVAKKELQKACVSQRTMSVNLNNIFALPEFEPLYDSFQLYNYIRIRTEDELLKLRILGLEISGDSLNSVTVTFADKIESITGAAEDVKSILDQAKSISTTYNATVKQAGKGSKASDYVSDLKNNGLLAANTMIKNDNSETFTITSAGAVAKRMDDVGFYGDKQLKVLGNGIYFTKDNWQTVCQAIGEFLFTDENGNKTLDYGIIAKNIIGELIAGNQLIISAGNGTVRIDGNGITLASGQCIKYEKDAPMNEIILEYMNSDSSTIAPDKNDKNWSSTCPKWELNKYIWQKMTITDVSGNSEVSITCISGKNGTDGKDGTDAHLYTIESNVDYIERKIGYKISGTPIEKCMYPNTIYVKSYVQKGDETSRVDHLGRYSFAESEDGENWTTTYVTIGNVPNSDNGGKGCAYQIQSATTNWIRCNMLVPNSTISLATITIPVILSDSIVSTKKQYYLSNSNTKLSNGTWMDTLPSWSGGKYIWSRDYIIYDSGYETATNEKYDSGITERLQDMTTFKNDTNKILNSLNPKTEIGDDYIISPKIGGGYAYFTNGTYSVEIDPNHKAGNNTLDGYLFCIRNQATPIMGVDNNGNGFFSGRVIGNKLELYNNNYKYGQFDIGEDTHNDIRYYGLGIMANGRDNIKDDDSHRRIVFGINSTIHEGIYFDKNSDGGWSSYHEINIPYRHNDYISFKNSDTTNYMDVSFITGVHDGVFADNGLYFNYHTDDNNSIPVMTIGKDLIRLGEQSIRLLNNKGIQSYNSKNGYVRLIHWTSSNNIFIGDYRGDPTRSDHDANCEANTVYLMGKNVTKIGSGAIGSLSDARYKTDVVNIPNAKEFIMNLKPKQYKFTDGSSNRNHFGFIAQDVERVMQNTTGDAGVVIKYNFEYDKEDKIDFNDDSTFYYGLRYEEIIAPLVQTVQEQQEQINDLVSEVKDLKEKLNGN